MGTFSLPIVDGEETIMVAGWSNIPFEVPLQLLHLSPVWRDALQVDALSKASEASEPEGPVTKKRKITRTFKLDDLERDLYMLSRILLDEISLLKKDEGLPLWRYISSPPKMLPRTLERLADKYALPDVRTRFLSRLWELASTNKEQAMYVFVIAWDIEAFSLAQHAMRQFRDLPHPEKFSLKMSRSLGIDVHWYLNNITRGRIHVDWVALADEMKPPSHWTKKMNPVVNSYLSIEIDLAPSFGPEKFIADID